MNIGEVSRISGVSVRTLRHYDQIGLLPPAQITPAGYRLYDEASLERLHTILLLRELEFPLREIRQIIDRPNFDPLRALEQQITLLTMRREHIDNLITLARLLKMKGLKHMDFSAFDKRKMDDYAAQAKAAWGETPVWKQYEERTHKDARIAQEEMAAIFAEFGQHRQLPPESDQAQALVARLRDYITDNFYDCSPAMMRHLADMYDGGGDFTRSLDRMGGPGTAEFTARAMRIQADQIDSMNQLV